MTKDKITPFSGIFMNKFLQVFIMLILVNLFMVYKGLDYFVAGPGYQVSLTTLGIINQHSLESERFNKLHEYLIEFTASNGESYTQDMYSLSVAGKFIPKHALLYSVLCVPFVAIFGLGGFLIVSDLLIIALFYAVISFSSFYSNNNRNFNLLNIILFFWGTQIIDYSFGPQYDVLATVQILLGLSLIFSRPLLGGAILTSSIFIRVTNICLVIPLLFLSLDKGLERKTTKIISTRFLGGLVVIIIWSVVNTVLWGGPLTTAYSRLPMYSKGHFVFDPTNFVFSYEILRQKLFEKFFDPTVGLITKNPIILVFPLACRALYLKGYKLDMLIILFTILSQIILFFSYQYWDSSHSGNRFLFGPIMISYAISLAYFRGFSLKSLKNKTVIHS